MSGQHWPYKKSLVAFLPFIFCGTISKGSVLFLFSTGEIHSANHQNLAFFQVGRCIYISASVSLLAIDILKLFINFGLILIGHMHVDIYPFLLEFLI